MEFARGGILSRIFRGPLAAFLTVAAGAGGGLPTGRGAALCVDTGGREGTRALSSGLLPLVPCTCEAGGLVLEVVLRETGGAACFGLGGDTAGV